MTIVLMNASVSLLISGAFWSSADFIAIFVFVIGSNSFTVYTPSPIVMLRIRFCLSSGSINLPATKFITLSLEKSKGLLLSLKYSKRISTAILAALFADGGNLWCRLYSSSTMRI